MMTRRVDTAKRRMEEEEKVVLYPARRGALAWNPGSAGPSAEPPPRPPPPPQRPPPLRRHTVEAAGQPAARRQMSPPSTARSALTACSTTTASNTFIGINQVRRSACSGERRCDGLLSFLHTRSAFSRWGVFQTSVLAPQQSALAVAWPRTLRVRVRSGGVVIRVGFTVRRPFLYRGAVQNVTAAITEGPLKSACFDVSGGFDVCQGLNRPKSAKPLVL